MKTLKLLILFIPICFSAYSQQLTGLWIGELVNDSTGRKQNFELALSEYRGKVTGYSYTTFIEDDKYYYSIKRIKATRTDSSWIIEDDKMVVNNFPEKAAKGVRQTTTFTMNEVDSTWHMSGNWKTNQTKVYYSLHGTMQMKEEKDHGKSHLFPHLGELRMDNTVSFYKPETCLTKMGQFRANKDEIAQTKTTPKANRPGSLALEKPVVSAEIKPEPKPTDTLVNTAVLSKPIDTLVNASVLPKSTDTVVNTAMLARQTETVKDPVVNNASVAKRDTQALVVKPVVKEVPARELQTIQYVEFESDSLLIALYDNGEVDGDTVSVFLNGEVLLAKQGLKASAIKKTIHIDPLTDSVRVVLFAENLGKYPPNTGLMTVRDGEQIYQIRFSADFQKSPEIVFRRKKGTK